MSVRIHVRQPDPVFVSVQWQSPIHRLVSLGVVLGCLHEETTPVHPILLILIHLSEM